MRQSEALAILGSGASVFLTGAPGAGKTYVLNEFIRQARADGASVAVTASTGIAATHINGTTIHSWSGIGLATALTDNLVKTVRTRRKRKLQEADILIIDEVSMLHAWLFDMVDRICRIIRRDERPFGGLQVVLSGDFFPAAAGFGIGTQQRPDRAVRRISGQSRTVHARRTQSRRFRHRIVGVA